MKNSQTIAAILVALLLVIVPVFMLVKESNTPAANIKKFHNGDVVKVKLDGRMGTVCDEDGDRNGNISIRIKHDKLHFWNDDRPYTIITVKPGEIEAN